MSKCVADLIRILQKLPATAHVEIKVNGLLSLSYPLEKVSFAKRVGVVRLESAEAADETDEPEGDEEPGKVNTHLYFCPQCKASIGGVNGNGDIQIDTQCKTCGNTFTVDNMAEIMGQPFKEIDNL